MSASSVLIMLGRGVLPADVSGKVIEIAAYHQAKYASNAPFPALQTKYFSTFNGATSSFFLKFDNNPPAPLSM